MNEGRTKTHLSKRIREQLNQSVADNSHNKDEKPLSTDEGQGEAVLEAVLGVSETVETPEKGYNLESKIVQNLDSNEVVNIPQQAANEAIFDEVFEPTAEVLDLQKMLQDSAEVVTKAPCSAKTISSEDLDAVLRSAPQPKIQLMASEVGVQPNGSYKVVVSITEEYVSGVLSAAESAERTPDQWATEQFQWFLDSYFTPNKGR
jgi:hypothetical protein